MTRLASLVVIAACGHSAGDTQAPVPTPAASPSDASIPSGRAWRTYAISNLGVEVSLFDGVEIQDHDIGGLRAVSQHDAHVTLLVVAGASASLAWWRQRFAPAAKLGTVTPVRVCGRAGQRQEVGAPAESATGMFATGRGRFEERTSDTPARVHVAIEGTTTAGASFVATWIVDAAHRDAMRTDEDHFLASITCS